MVSKKFSDWLKRDFIYIVVSLFALFACIWTIGSANDFQTDCNIHWEEQMNTCNCQCNNRYDFNDSFSLILPIKHFLGDDINENKTNN